MGIGVKTDPFLKVLFIALFLFQEKVQ